MSAEPRVTPLVPQDKVIPVTLCALAPVAWFLIFYTAAPYLPESPIAAYCAGFAAVVASTLAVSRVAPVTGRLALLLAASALVASFALWEKSHSGASPSWRYLGAHATCLIFGGTAIGAFVGARIQHPGHLLFVVLASSIADVFSVFSPDGPSAAIASSEVALSLFAVSWPMLGSNAIAPFLGVGDIVFSGLYFAWARRHALALGRTWIALAAGYVVTMIAVLVLQSPVPALPFLGGAMLVAHPEARRPPVADRRRGLLVLSVMAALFLVLLLRPRQ